ncbi:sterile alpha motif domain-containing 3-like protein, partial [Clarias magur]
IFEEFLRISGISLESTFMSQLDRQTPKLLSLFNTKGGAVGQRIKSQMMTLIQ